jgi:hypothetical protein
LDEEAKYSSVLTEESKKNVPPVAIRSHDARLNMNKVGNNLPMVAATWSQAAKVF